MQIPSKVFVVTGADNGIGRAVVLELVRRGAKVAAVDLSETGLAETERLARPQGRITRHVLDVSDRAGVEGLPEQVLAEHGQVDGVLNVAGSSSGSCTSRSCPSRRSST